MEEKIDILEGIGLTNQESRVYLAMLKLHEAKLICLTNNEIFLIECKKDLFHDVLMSFSSKTPDKN